MSVAEAAIVSLSTLVFFEMISRYLTMRIQVSSALNAYLRVNGVRPRTRYAWRFRSQELG